MGQSLEVGPMAGSQVNYAEGSENNLMSPPQPLFVEPAKFMGDTAAQPVSSPSKLKGLKKKNFN